MKNTYLLLIGAVLMGGAAVPHLLAACGAAPEDRGWTPPPSGDAGQDGASEADCGPVVSTKMPGVAGPVITLCTSCSGGCENLGGTCERYGSECGDNGVCIACCAGARGELRCGPK